MMAIALIGAGLFWGPQSEVFAKRKEKTLNQRPVRVTTTKPRRPVAEMREWQPSAQPVHPSATKVETWNVYNACMGSDDPLGKSAEFFASDRKISVLKKILGKWPLDTPARFASELCAVDALKHYETLLDITSAPKDELVSVDHPWVGQNDDLVRDQRYVASPWVRDYIRQLANRTFEELRDRADGAPTLPLFVVSSLVRSKDIQRKQWNSPARCETENALCSSHTTGSTFDITLKDLSGEHNAALKKILARDRESGKISFILEPRGNHYHIFVFPPELAARVAEFAAQHP